MPSLVIAGIAYDIESSGGGGGTFTSVTAGDGLSGGTITTSGTIAVDGTVLRTSGSYADPSWLTSLSATKLTGTIADARLSANVPLLNTANVFSATNTFAIARADTSFQIKNTGGGYGVIAQKHPSVDAVLWSSLGTVAAGAFHLFNDSAGAAADVYGGRFGAFTAIQLLQGGANWKNVLTFDGSNRLIVQSGAASAVARIEDSAGSLTGVQAASYDLVTNAGATPPWVYFDGSNVAYQTPGTGQAHIFRDSSYTPAVITAKSLWLTNYSYSGGYQILAPSAGDDLLLRSFIAGGKIACQDSVGSLTQVQAASYTGSGQYLTGLTSRIVCCGPQAVVEPSSAPRVLWGTTLIASDYTSRTIIFQSYGSVSNGSLSGTVVLYNLTTSSIIATLSFSSTTPGLQTASVTLTSGTNTYEARAYLTTFLTSPDALNVDSVELKVY